jgi:hypothetical protein
MALSKIVLMGDILTIRIWFVHIPHAAITISVQMIDVITAIIVTKSSYILFCITYTNMNPYHSNNGFPHSSQ